MSFLIISRVVSFVFVLGVVLLLGALLLPDPVTLIQAHWKHLTQPLAPHPPHSGRAAHTRLLQFLASSTDGLSDGKYRQFDCYWHFLIESKLMDD